MVSRVLCVIVALLAPIAPAFGQALPVAVSPLEVAIGVSLNGVSQDANSAPECVSFGLPCTHERAHPFGGVGLEASVARNLTDRFAIVGDAGVFGYGWDSSPAGVGRHAETSLVTSAYVGPSISTGFFDPGNGDRSPGRFYGRVLVGAEAGDVVPVRASMLAGAGADVAIPRGADHAFVLRLALDYRLTPGDGRNSSGLRFTCGLVFGPHVK